MFLLTVNNKNNFSLGSQPVDNTEQVCYLFRKKALFSFRLRGPAAKWYADSTDEAATWVQIRTAFIDSFSDDQDKYKHRITADNCVRGKEKFIKNCYHWVKSAVDKRWPLDPKGTQAERGNQQKQRNAKHIEITVRRLKNKRTGEKSSRNLDRAPKCNLGCLPGSYHFQRRYLYNQLRISTQGRNRSEHQNPVSRTIN